ncbi:MAG: hypothetical protein A2Y79_05330 [Deltaproteobacteria bacterium RBG_13_43_22]|nr:MAG: hypothetical protein A2Y79_05330 [Deltaproteobacteria bacterium RBG_13_43_22]
MPKILAIDDKKDNLITLSALLKNLMPDCAVISAQSGLEGIKKARAELPDVILLDVKMPEMDGFETCRRLRSDENTNHIPVIMITAIKIDPWSRIKGMEIGADAFLAKPIDEGELVSQIKVALRIKKAEDALRAERDILEKSVQEKTVHLLQEITERKQAEGGLRESEKLYRSLFEKMINGFAYCRMLFEDGRPQDFIYLVVNDAFELQTGLKDVVGKRVTEVIPGIREADPQLFEIYGRVAMTGRPERFEMFLNILQMWFWVSVYSPAKDHFVAVFDVITERKKAEGKLTHTLENLRNALTGIIQVIAATVETRDPYTAGHQRRTADLARTIAGEMGLTEDQQDGLLMAGIIHDLGKVSIPAEILSKPTQLTDIEYKLIKEHSQIGYEILKNIDFPWPIAEIVLKHHERLNGSGYPQGLKGKEICLEARILMVADVVEAMASYRPYRPALGIEAALEEIEKNKGILYDSRVVEVCLGLFREKGFSFE